MSTITRAFTKRSKRPEVSAPMPHREGHQAKFSSGTIKRGKISGPVELLSTTNMLAYNAPDLALGTSSSSSSSLQSPDDSELSSPQQSIPTPITSPDDSTHDSSPVDSGRPTSYFPQRSATVTSQPRSSTSSTADTPMVPKRALSHTKRSHQDLSRQRSQKRTSPPLNTSRSSPSIKTSQDFAKPEPHPFGRELAQVNEVVEEFGGSYALEEEETMLREKGLMKFSADDYRLETEALYASIFDDQLGPIATGTWL